MKCDLVRSSIDQGDENPELRDHLRHCADCLEWAIASEPTNLFLPLGAGDRIPEGGIDLFVSEVLSEVRLRETERVLEPAEHPLRTAWWWSAAAAVFILVATWATLQPKNVQPPVHSPVAAVESVPADEVDAEIAVSRPVVDDYEESAAMIVELPTSSSDELKIVMIFDETLPQDL